MRPLPKLIGINKKLVTKKTHPETTPKASGLEIKNYRIRSYRVKLTKFPNDRLSYSLTF